MARPGKHAIRSLEVTDLKAPKWFDDEQRARFKSLLEDVAGHGLPVAEKTGELVKSYVVVERIVEKRGEYGRIGRHADDRPHLRRLWLRLHAALRFSDEKHWPLPRVQTGD